jgi:hypothetical protein
LGIGRTAGTNKLEVEGEASKATAGDWLANSSASIKKDIAPLDGALDIISRLRPVRFQYSDDYKAAHSSVGDFEYFNFVAEEYRQVFPNFVREDASGLLQIDTHPASVFAVAAIQELNQVVQEKDERIASMEERLTALEQRDGVPPAGSPAMQLSGQPANGLRLEMALVLCLAGLLTGALLGAGLMLKARR